MSILRLHPLAQWELARRRPDFLDRLLGDGFGTHRWERLATATA